MDANEERAGFLWAWMSTFLERLDLLRIPFGPSGAGLHVKTKRSQKSKVSRREQPFSGVLIGTNVLTVFLADGQSRISLPSFPSLSSC